jgi:3-isopropylmalate dehydrogenase
MSVDKASVYATSRLWRRVSRATAAATGLAIVDVNVDRAAYELVKDEELPAVIVTEGLFGDILSDIVCARAGSPALCGSATINPDRAFGSGVTALFEPAHGSSPHRTGSRRSNPTGAWLALADLLEWCPDLAELGLHAAVRGALDAVLDAGAPTYDLARPDEPTLDLDQFNERVLEALATVTA